MNYERGLIIKTQLSMTTNHAKPKLIEKEKVEMLNFPEKEVLATEEDISRRKNEM
jgi:hypothetical protein